MSYDFFGSLLFSFPYCFYSICACSKLLTSRKFFEFQNCQISLYSNVNIHAYTGAAISFSQYDFMRVILIILSVGFNFHALDMKWKDLCWSRKINYFHFASVCPQSSRSVFSDVPANYLPIKSGSHEDANTPSCMRP